MEQPIPKVSDKDVERIAIRDYGVAQLSQVMSIIREYGKQEWNYPGSPRVRLAILKLANGDIEQLSKYTEAAIQDIRDVLSMAEYPKYSKEIGFNRVSNKLKKEIIVGDWNQYKEWLDKQ